ncbi:sensor domain-containing protein [Mycobacterium heidelbergense]|uniref:sensor domain-containing protein n=1 Tax=Mycobacterium heidelbergense TaxID=53376 RepID=UPI003CF9B826
MDKSMWATALAICTVAAACAGHPAPQATSAPPSPAAPIAASALPGLLLNTEQVNTTMGATGMTVEDGKNYTQMSTAEGIPAECAGVAIPAAAPAYAGSGWTGYQGQVLFEPGDQLAHYVDQDVVAFPTAGHATAFYKQAGALWRGCSNRSYTARPPDPGKNGTWDVGPVKDSDGMLTAIRQSERHVGWRCQRALTVANNVVIDVMACAYGNANTLGVTLAKQLAAKAAPGSGNPGK